MSFWRGVLNLTMVVVVDQWFQPAGYLAIWVFSKVVALLVKVITKGGTAMANRVTQIAKRLAANRDAIALSGVTR